MQPCTNRFCRFWSFRHELFLCIGRAPERMGSCARSKNRQSNARHRTFNDDDDVFMVWGNDIKQQRRGGIKVLVQFGFSRGIDNANIHFPCMQIDAAIKFVTLIVKSVGLPPFFVQWLMYVVLIGYTLPDLRRQPGRLFPG